MFPRPTILVTVKVNVRLFPLGPIPEVLTTEPVIVLASVTDAVNGG